MHLSLITIGNEQTHLSSQMSPYLELSCSFLLSVLPSVIGCLCIFYSRSLRDPCFFLCYFVLNTEKGLFSFLIDNLINIFILLWLKPQSNNE